MLKPSLDKVVGIIVGLGVPGLILLTMIGGAGGAAAGATAITAALATFGPGGMVGGIITLPIAVIVLKGVSEYGVEKILVQVLKEMKSKGHSKNELLNKIEKYPVSKKLKLSLKEKIKEFYSTNTITVVS
mgnify:CR=1 FL=1